MLQKHLCSSIIISLWTHPPILFTLRNDISIEPIPNKVGKGIKTEKHIQALDSTMMTRQLNPNLENHAIRRKSNIKKEKKRISTRYKKGINTE